MQAVGPRSLHSGQYAFGVAEGISRADDGDRFAAKLPQLVSETYDLLLLLLNQVVRVPAQSCGNFAEA